MTGKDNSILAKPRPDAAWHKKKQRHEAPFAQEEAPGEDNKKPLRILTRNLKARGGIAIGRGTSILAQASPVAASMMRILAQEEAHGGDKKPPLSLKRNLNARGGIAIGKDNSILAKASYDADPCTRGGAMMLILAQEEAPGRDDKPLMSWKLNLNAKG